MTFIVEDGTGLDNSNAYISVAEFKSYWDLRGYDYTSNSDANIEVAIVKSTGYVDIKNCKRFKGRIKHSEQSLQFPREYLYDSIGNQIKGIPTKLKNAVAEYTKRALVAELVADPTVSDTGLSVKSSKEKVGPIETVIEYTGDVISTFKSYPSADLLLQEFVYSGSCNAVRC